MRRTLSRILTIGTLALALAGTSLAFISPATEAQAMTASRLSGADRYETSVAISQAMPWTGDTVFLASGVKFPDALAAGPVAAAEDAHLLLTTPNAVPASIMNELRRLAPAHVVIVGDANSISSSVATAVRTAIGADVERIAGANRYETALRLLDRLDRTSEISELWVVAGSKFPDALVAGSIAGGVGGGILLAPTSSSPAVVQAWIGQSAHLVAGVPVRIAGSEASVSGASEQALLAAGAASVDRYAGSNRYETAREIHDTFSTSVASGRMLLATGENFPDALGGSLLAAELDEPLYLAPPRCNTGIATMLRAERDERGIDAVLGLGGAPSLSDQALRLQDCPPPPAEPPAGPPPSSAVNCSDFATWAAAQAWYLYWLPTLGDVGGLDNNDDGTACESLPGAP